MMMSYFTFSEYVHDLLFYGWTTHNRAEFAGTCIAVFVTAFLIEGIKVAQERFSIQADMSPLDYVTARQHENGRPDFLNPLAIPASLAQIKRRRIYYKLLDGVSYIARIVLGYALMLFVMTYNAWFLIASVTGYLIGYYAFTPFNSSRPRAARDRSPAPTDTPITEIERWSEPTSR